MVRDLSKNNELILEARNVTKQFKVSKNNTLTACDNINLSMYKGKTLGIVGESGCGKSTFLRMLMNLEKISSGEIFYKVKILVNFQKMRFGKVDNIYKWSIKTLGLLLVQG